jgi:hypothetical protein
MLLEHRKIKGAQGSFVGGFEQNRRRYASSEGFVPAVSAQTPAVTGREAGKSKHWLGCAEVVTLGLGKRQKGFSHNSTHHVYAAIICAGVAVTVAVKTG